MTPPTQQKQRKWKKKKGGGGGNNNNRNNNNLSSSNSPNTSSTNDVYVQTKNGTSKFIGGAAMARRKAVAALRNPPQPLPRPKGNRILRPGERAEQQQRERVGLPSGLSPFERFCAGLLRSEMIDYLGGSNLKNQDNSKSNNAKQTHVAVWKVACKRLDLSVPTQPLPASYQNSRLHFTHRAALVVEEARHGIADGVRKLHRRLTIENSNNKTNQKQQATNSRRQTNNRKNWSGGRNNNNNNSNYSMLLTVSISEYREKSGHTRMCVSKDQGGPFTREEISDYLRHGTVFACLNKSLASRVSNMVFGCILPGDRDEMIQSNSFSVIVFRKLSVVPNTQWELFPIASLLSEQRKFEACTSTAMTKIPFLIPLLGGKERTHTRFMEDDDGNSMSTTKNELSKNTDDDDSDDDVQVVGSNFVSSHFRLKPLNPSQEHAAQIFLNSESNTITLVQGPPGTGKTTLLVSVMTRYITESIECNLGRTLLVCAPTNKAVSVLCTRFLDAITNADYCPCNVVLVGDEDKLLDDDYNRMTAARQATQRSSLRSIFLYTWIGTVLDDYMHLRNRLSGSKGGRNSNKEDFLYMFNLSRRVQTRVQRCLGNSQDLLSSTLLETMEEITNKLTKQSPNDATILELLGQIDQVMVIVRNWRSDHILRCLLGSAHIVFCTLASAGTGIVKKSLDQVDDLVVDEAAASTEPEMYIPMIFRPKRLLAVGDPKQLPATVMSPMAEGLGMSRSLHERLMYDCGHSHIMVRNIYPLSPCWTRYFGGYFVVLFSHPYVVCYVVDYSLIYSTG